MIAMINNPASYKVCNRIWVLFGKNNTLRKFTVDSYKINGPNVMSDSKIRNWCCLFKEGQTNVHDDDGGNSQPSVVTDNLVEKLMKNLP